MSLQLDLPYTEQKQIAAASVKPGDCFLRNNEILMRVKPVNFILNSNLIVDCINNNKIFVVNVLKGTFWAIPGSDRVVPVKMVCKLRV